MFFSLSKIFWYVAEPGNLLLIFLLIGVALLWIGWRRAGLWLVTLAVLAGLFLAVVPIGPTLRAALENRFPAPKTLPEKVDGVVVLGGVIDQFVSEARKQTSINGAVERLTEFAALAKRYPQARLIFTGGSGVLGSQGLKEAHYVGPFLASLGLNPARVMFEDQSRNTAENARLSKDLAVPKPGEKWILITSAFHMPRAVGSFRKMGWSVIPYPVDYSTLGKGTAGFSFSLTGGLSSANRSIHEWVGLLFYKLTGRTNEIYPAPSQGAE